MKADLITTKITPEGLAMLRWLAKRTPELQYEILERLLMQEVTRVSLASNITLEASVRGNSCIKEEEVER